MPTLLLRLMAPMQSWGSTSRFDQRDTGKEPTKSGVIGLLAAAMGIDRNNWADLQPLTMLTMGVRHDRPGVLRMDYQTAGCAATDMIVKADGKLSKDGIVSERFYLADAAFLVGMEGPVRPLLERAHEALRNPHWVLGLGRKSYVPSEPVYLPDGMMDCGLREAMISYPFLSSGLAPTSLQYSFESTDRTGRMVMDQVLSSFTERRFGSRFIRTEWNDCAKEAEHVPA